MTTFGGWPQIGNCSFSNPNSIVNGPATIVPLGASSGGDGRDASSGGCLHDGAPPNVNSGVFCGAGSSGVEAGFGHGGYLGGSSWVAWPASNHQALRPNMAVGAATAAPEVGNHQMQTNCVDTGTGCGPDLGRTQVLDGPCVGSTTGVGVVHACNSSVSFGNSASTQSMPVPGAPVQLSVGQQSSAWGASVPMPILASPQQLPPSGQSSPSTQVSVSMGGDATPSVQAGGMLSPAMNSWPGMLSGNVANGKMPPLGRVPPGGGAGLDVVRAAMALVPAQVAQDPRGFSILCAVPSRRVNDLVGRDGSAAEQVRQLTNAEVEVRPSTSTNSEYRAMSITGPLFGSVAAYIRMMQRYLTAEANGDFQAENNARHSKASSRTRSRSRSRDKRKKK